MTDSPSILIKFPSRERPKKMLSCIENIRAMIGIEDYVIALALDLDDPSCNNQPVKEALKQCDNVIVYWGLSRNKIQAVNRSIPLNINWKYLVVTSDDMFFIRKNFGKEIIDAFEDYPDAGLLHFPDQHVNEKLITLPVMTRAYYERFGYVYHPDYVSVKADKEQMEVAQRIGKYQYVDLDIVEHRHWRWKKTERDQLYKRQDSPANFALDGLTYHNRLVKNFDL
jgi:hypothetical protein